MKVAIVGFRVQGSVGSALPEPRTPSCGRSIHLFQRRYSGSHFVHAVLSQRLHADGSADLADFVEGGAQADALDHVVVGDEQLVDADSPGVAEAAAAGAALGAVGGVQAFAGGVELAVL